MIGRMIGLPGVRVNACIRANAYAHARRLDSLSCGAGAVR